MRCPDCRRELISNEACICGWRSDKFEDFSIPEKRRVKAFLDEEKHLIDYWECQRQQEAIG